MKNDDLCLAPGRPGTEAHWAPAAKSGVGCAVSAKSQIWFTLGRGIVYEVFHPWIDHIAIRDFGLIVTGPDGFYSDEQHDCQTAIATAAPGVPLYHLTNVCAHGRYRITKEIFADPERDVVLQRITFRPLKGKRSDYRLFAICSPRLGGQGDNNSGWAGAFHGKQMLLAQHTNHALAIGSSVPWLNRSVGYVGVSDAREDLKQHGTMTWIYDRADHGHIALAGEIDLEACGGEFDLALAVDRSPEAAALNASLSLISPWQRMRDTYADQWRDWHKTLKPLDDGKWKKLAQANAAQRNRPDSSRPRVAKTPAAGDEANLYRTSAMVLKVHRSKAFAGASVASLSVPWGEARGQKDNGGYHLVWPRDLVEESGGFLAAGTHEETKAVLDYLRVTQRRNGGWAQAMWLDGSAYSDGVQLDEAALPILLVSLADRESAIDEDEVQAFWPMVRAAAIFIVREGPSTGQSRWENSPGLSPYTLATEVAALLVAARLADRFGEKTLGRYFRETADLWNDSIEAWTYVTGTIVAQRLGIDGHYIRLAPPPGMKALRESGESPHLKTSRDLPNAEVISPDALALVRFGLRAANDPRIVNTIKAIDGINRVQTPAGPCWRRYTGGYYGESDEGAPFIGGKEKHGHGRAWPLLTGERGHFEVAAGNLASAQKMLETMGGLCSQIGLLPEQVWDADDLPAHDLFFGRPAGSAMPLAWTHSEYVRLLRSLRDKRVFDMPADTQDRYLKRKIKSDLALWRFDLQPFSFSAGRRVRIEVLDSAIVRYSTDGWATFIDAKTTDPGTGFHVADLQTGMMRPGEILRFTFHWPTEGRWEGTDFQVQVDGDGTPVQSKPSKPKRQTQKRKAK